MNYSCSVDINQPLQQVVALFDNPENWPHWQSGLISVEHLSKHPRETGAQSRLQFKIGRRDMELLETVVKRNLPEEFIVTYEGHGVHNKVRNLFAPIDDQSTRYVTEQEFSFKGFMKLLAFFTPGAFKKETINYMMRFKEFAESKNPTRYGQ